MRYFRALPYAALHAASPPLHDAHMNPAATPSDPAPAHPADPASAHPSAPAPAPAPAPDLATRSPAPAPRPRTPRPPLPDHVDPNDLFLDLLDPTVEIRDLCRFNALTFDALDRFIRHPWTKRAIELLEEIAATRARVLAADARAVALAQLRSLASTESIVRYTDAPHYIKSPPAAETARKAAMALLKQAQKPDRDQPHPSPPKPNRKPESESNPATNPETNPATDSQHNPSPTPNQPTPRSPEHRSDRAHAPSRTPSDDPTGRAAVPAAQRPARAAHTADTTRPSKTDEPPTDNQPASTHAPTPPTPPTPLTPPTPSTTHVPPQSDGPPSPNRSRAPPPPDPADPTPSPPPRPAPSGGPHNPIPLSCSARFTADAPRAPPCGSTRGSADLGKNRSVSFQLFTGSSPTLHPRGSP